MPAGRPGASALLQKVNSQLRGERVPIVTKEEDELAVYLSGLQQKTQQVRSTSFEDHGDISISSGKGDRFSGPGRRLASPAAPANKFLKKKKPSELQQANKDAGDDERGIIIAGEKKAPRQGSAVLDKAHKVKDFREVGSPLHRHMSRDSDSESDLGRRPTSADTSMGRDGRKFLKGRVKVSEDDTKPKTRTPSPQLAQRGGEEKSKQRRSSKARGEIVRTLGNVYLSSEEESLAEFIHGLSVSEASSNRPQNLVAKKQQKWRKTRTRQSPSPVHSSRSPSPFKRSPSPRGKMSRSISQDSDLLDSMAMEVMEERRGRAGSASSDDNFNINLMDVASLLPASSPSPRQKKSGNKRSRQSSSSGKDPFKASSTNLASSHKKKGQPSKKKGAVKKSDSKSSVFGNLGIHMVDELLDVGGARDLADQSEIHTEESDNDRKVARRKEESESEIITELGGGDSRKVPIRRALFPEKSVTISERIGMDTSVRRKPRSLSLSNDETDTETSLGYTDDTFETHSKTVSRSQSLSQTSPRRRKKSKTSHSQGSQRQVVVEQRHTQVTTADVTGMPHHWQALQTGVTVSGPYGLQYVDPAPVATHVVSADALEAMTAYSPSVLALQEMMQAQLGLVRNFVDLQARIYQSCMQGLNEDFHYTTLEGTKKFIEENRKPRMTFKEALQLVEQEEGLAV